MSYEDRVQERRKILHGKAEKSYYSAEGKKQNGRVSYFKFEY